MKETNDTYLSDWLAHKITDEQLKQLVTEDDFIAFQKIKNTLKGQQIEHPDLDKNFNAIKQKMASRKTKPTKVISIWKYSAIAACLILCFGVYHFFIDSNTVLTDIGANKVLVLSDNSKVVLNSKSKLCYTNYFNYKRTLQLEGEAFFEVQKGSSFTVQTPLGNVRVLGTKFNVISFRDFFEVVCYEGKVEVTKNGKATVLTHGESIRFYDNTVENWADLTAKKPSWLMGESSFRNVPMQYVIDQFRNQYHITVSYPVSIEDVKFTGTFTHNNLDVALRTICIPLHLKYTKTGSGKILISE
ncbi:FecR family protein [Flavobacterium phycosphaerae]|uniref:FecR family protein n=1 Tax=Flavobacterium phycosphaerae TaxID=2697515 RepID=UPI00138A6280|nr:FecR domain-containing protein [Flavobacterium phycosphaerae]